MESNEESTSWICSPVADINSVLFHSSPLQTESVNVNLSKESAELITLAESLVILQNALSLSKLL